MNKILMILLLPLLFILPSCDSGGDGGSNASCNESDVIGDWDGVTLDTEYIGSCGDEEDVIGYDISSVDVHIDEDGTYAFISNGNEEIDDEEGTWECNGANIDICETGDECATWSLDIDGNNATISIDISEAGCTVTLTVDLVKDTD